MGRLFTFLAGLGLTGILAACGGGSVLVQPIAISSNITVTTTWVPNTAIGCDYLVSSGKEIEVSAALTILPGTEVCFASNSGLKITETGSMTAVGTASSRIVFTGATASKGFWKGLAFRSNNPANELTFVDVLFAGSNDNFCCDYFNAVNISAAVLIGSNATATSTLKLTNSKIASSANFGLFVFNSGRISGFSSNSFSDNSKAPVAVPIIEMSKLDSASVYSGAGAVANTVNVVQVNESPSASTTVNQTIVKLDVPYAMMLGDPGTEQEYQGSLTIQPGVRLEFESNSGLEIMPSGSLNAVGTVANPIVFSGRVATKGYWKGLAFRSNNPANRLERSTIEFAGNNDNFCCDYFTGSNISAAVVVGANAVSNATLALVNSTIRDSDNFGAYQFAGGNTITASGNTYTNNDSGNNPVGLP